MKAQIINDVIVAYGNSIGGTNVFEPIPEDYSPEKYTYTPSIAGVFDPNGFTLKAVNAASIDFEKRAYNVRRMNNYMFSLVLSDELTQPGYEQFCSEAATNISAYQGGTGRLITWIETTSRNNYDASTSGFKNKSAYRGALVDGVYPRAEMILSILNDL